MMFSSPFALPLRPVLASLLLCLAACATTQPPLPQRPGVYPTPAPGAGSSGASPGTVLPGGSVSPGTPPPPAATPLAQEQRFLEDWFRGTPVLISAQPPTTLQLDVPLANSFDAGKADVKPALNAVLERVAQSMLRHAGARLTVTVPSDANGALALAQARTQRVRDVLAGKGIAATRIALIESTRAGPVLLRLSMPAVSSQPIARGGSSSSSGGVQPVSNQRNAPAWTEKKQP